MRNVACVLVTALAALLTIAALCVSAKPTASEHTLEFDGNLYDAQVDFISYDSEHDTIEFIACGQHYVVAYETYERVMNNEE